MADNAFLDVALTAVTDTTSRLRRPAPTLQTQRPRPGRTRAADVDQKGSFNTLVQVTDVDTGDPAC